MHTFSLAESVKVRFGRIRMIDEAKLKETGGVGPLLPHPHCPGNKRAVRVECANVRYTQ